ncbi:neutral/alkaline non-lysosomal ceramidase N-terminal domain-containing protein [Blastopirellula sp. J2-11]|uniref:neutral/alkaline non-lysosomal ceramidase N-terminal domain-containing protein n=1 Tax=Blastopirellula sp. J2-11 TaxID=2943192 RepID=UPI0021CA4188|nr:neutral/alkaline non-lysosomal ceramidase N-terminal domain-containing protein [Blastopirellula sp. J2-11]UUO07952.1 neutral/alkaline non-lysosomal ceramidase N-terminal domain-containing protein [Blastopirellula sp. J2-11]
MPRFSNAPLLLLAGCLVISSCITGFAAEEAKPVFRAGAVTSNITPPLGQKIVGGWQPIPATHIHDELHARCIVLDDGQTKLAIVVCDNVGIPREVFDAAKEQITKETGIPASHQLMSATHTHSATTARGPFYILPNAAPTDYQSFLAGRIADGVRRAINQLEPAQIGWGAIDEPSEVFNRRWYVKDAGLLTNPFGGMDRVRMNPPRGSAALDRPAGPTDPEISFISIQSKAGRPIALLANYSLHYVGGVPSGDVSADYFGYFAKFIEKKLNATDQTPAFVGILSNGTSGDVNNINFSEKNGKRYGRYEKMQEVAEKVAAKVQEAHEKLEFQDYVTLDAAASELPLKVRKPTPEMIEHFQEVRARAKAGGKQEHRRELIYADRIDRLQESPAELMIPLQALRIGDLAITAIPFETFTETGLELKARTPLAKSFTIELANGSFGYLPTPEQHRLGGYETWMGTSSVEIDATTKIVAELLKLEQSLTPAAGE